MCFSFGVGSRIISIQRGLDRQILHPYVDTELACEHIEWNGNVGMLINKRRHDDWPVASEKAKDDGAIQASRSELAANHPSLVRAPTGCPIFALSCYGGQARPPIQDKSAPGPIRSAEFGRGYGALGRPASHALANRPAVAEAKAGPP
jgi:hypothetical protein